MQDGSASETIKFEACLPSPIIATGQDKICRFPAGRTRMTGALEHLSYEERLRELSLLSLKKRQQRGDLINICKYLKWGAKRTEPGSAQWCQPPGLETTGRTWCRGSFTWTRGRVSLHCVATVYWNRRPREAVQGPSPETLQSHLYSALCHELWDGPAPAGRLDHMNPLCSLPAWPILSFCKHSLRWDFPCVQPSPNYTLKLNLLCANSSIHGQKNWDEHLRALTN